MKNDIDIAVCYHKPSMIFESDALKPMHVGRAKSNLDLGIRGDDTGDNISAKNQLYAELTATYWLWKNSDAKIKGLMHYRRLLDLSGAFCKTKYDVELESIAETEKFLDVLGLTTKNISELLKDNVALVRYNEDLCTWSDYSLEQHFRESHISRHWDMAMEAIRAKFPEYLESVKYAAQSSEFYPTNIIIMKSVEFDKYCEFLFGVLLDVEKGIDMNAPEILASGDWGTRSGGGCLGERLTSMFVSYLKYSGESVAEFPVVQIVPTGGDIRLINTYDANAYNLSKAVEIPNLIDDAKPKISVCLACYNVGKYLNQALKSVVGQTLRNIEIIIVNDGSTDNTGLIADGYAKKDSRIRVIHQENRGLAYSRNVGMEHANGQYIHLMDGDDFLDLDFLEAMVRNADLFESDLVISTHKSFLDGSRDVLNESIIRNVSGGKLTLKTEPKISSFPCHVWDKIFSADIAKQAGFLDDNAICEDVWFWWRSITMAKSISIQPLPKINYRLREGSVQQDFEKIMRGFSVLDRTHDYIQELKRRDVQRGFYIDVTKICAHIIKKNHVRLCECDGDREDLFLRMKKTLEKCRVGDVTEVLAIRKLESGSPYSEVVKAVGNQISDDEYKYLNRCRRKIWKYKILQFLTLGFVKSFSERKSEYRKRLKALLKIR